MRTWRLLGYEIKFHFSLEKVKRIEIPIPDWADDAHLRQGRHGGWGTSDGKTKVVYYKEKEMERFEISIPECKRSVEISVTPLYKKQRFQEYNTNRKIVIDIFY